MSYFFWALVVLVLGWLLLYIWRKLKTPILQGIHNFRFPKDKGGHQWRFIRESSSYLCNLCHKEIQEGIINGSYCVICGMYAHNMCSRRMADKCKAVHSGHSKLDRHQWVEGNLPLETFCTVCHVICGNPEYNFDGMRCIWCQRVVHKSCREKLPEECDCGQFAAMLLKPSEIQYEKVATNMARFKRGLGSMMKKSIERVKRLRRRGGNGQNNHAPEEPLALDKWTFKFGERINPIIVCVNSKSGGHKGDEILHSFYRYLNPLQVVDLVNEGIESINKFRDLPRWRLVIAGGDGTVSWVLNYVYGAMKPRYYPEVGLVPLGTGNDLSRVLGWGKTIGDTEMQDYLKTFDSKTTLTLLDRWKLTFTYKRPTKVWSGLKRQAAVRTTSEVKYMYNYFGLGIDAKITKDFHTLRDQYPSLFTNRLINKVWYSQVGTRELIMGACKNINQKVQMVCEGKTVEMPYLEGMTIINIPSQVGGVDYWGNHLLANSDRFVRQSTCDQTIEAVGVRSVLHMGQCIIGLDGGIRLCQGKSISLSFPTGNKIPMQIDGEPFTHQEGEVTVNIEFDAQIRMLKTVESNANVVEKKCYQVIDWAKQNGHITADQAKVIEHELIKAFNT